MRGLVTWLLVCLAFARADACPTVEEGRWPWAVDVVLRGAVYDPALRGPIPVPPRPRIVALRRTPSTPLPVFRTPEGRVIPHTVTACGQVAFLDLELTTGLAVVRDIPGPGQTETFVVTPGLSMTTRHAAVVTDAFQARLDADSDAIALRMDHPDGTQSLQFNGPYKPLHDDWEGTRVVAIYADRREEVILGAIPSVRSHGEMLALVVALVGVGALVKYARSR